MPLPVLGTPTSGRSFRDAFGPNFSGLPMFDVRRQSDGPQGRAAPWWMLGEAGREGFFKPFLPSSFLSPLIAQHVSDSQARMRQAMLGSQAFGRGDPSLRGFAALQGLFGEQGNLARILGATRAESQMNQLKFLQDLMKDFGGVSFRGGFTG